MKKKLILFFSILLLFVFIFIGRFILLQVQTVEGRLKIVASPNAKVFLNNAEIGKTPFEQKVKQGEYLLKLTAIDDSTKSAVMESKIIINKNSLTYVNQDIGSSTLSSSGIIFSLIKMQEKPTKPNTGEIEVHSDPTGATVYLNNEDQGNTSLILSNIDKGQQEITISSPGFFPRSEKVEIITGYRIVTQFKLAIDPSHKKIDEKEIQKEATKSADGALTPSPSIASIVLIKETGTGFLRVRSEPSLSATESARVTPGKKYKMLEEQQDWIKIEYENGKTGWVSARYTEKVVN